MAETVSFPALDGRALAGTVFRAEQPRGAVVIAPAMGVPQPYYARFAQFLAREGLTTVTFDYRGMGRSRVGPVRDEKAALHDWGELDLAGALEFGRTLGRLQVLTHSVGGQIFGLIPRPDVLGAVFVGSQSGHWREWSGPARAALFALSHAVMPAFTQTLGFLPMRAFRQGENLPREVAAEWARWIRHPDYVWSYAAPRGGLGFTAYQGPLYAYAIADDGYAPLGGVKTLLSRYSGAQRELRVVRPAELGVGVIGHFGPFREKFRDTLWKDIAARLLARL